MPRFPPFPNPLQQRRSGSRRAGCGPGSPAAGSPQPPTHRGSREEKQHKMGEKKNKIKEAKQKPESRRAPSPRRRRGRGSLSVLWSCRAAWPARGDAKGLGSGAPSGGSPAVTVGVRAPGKAGGCSRPGSQSSELRAACCWRGGRLLRSKQPQGPAAGHRDGKGSAALTPLSSSPSGASSRDGGSLGAEIPQLLPGPAAAAADPGGEEPLRAPLGATHLPPGEPRAGRGAGREPGGLPSPLPPGKARESSAEEKVGRKSKRGRRKKREREKERERKMKRKKKEKQKKK